MYCLKKEKDTLSNELLECAERIALLEKVVGYKLRLKKLSWIRKSVFRVSVFKYYMFPYT